jgi:glycosyltransferase involved in cell wall biosynthesis
MVQRAIESVLAQTYRPIEILVVDDGSTDETPAVLASLEASNPGVIRVLRSERRGPGLAREVGRRAARGEFLQYLDSDDWLLPEKFAAQVQLLRERPECGIAYGVTRFVDAEGAVLTEASKWTGRELEFLFPGLLVQRWWHTSTPLYRRAVSDAAGEWPARRPEDWDLEARMGAARVRLAYAPVPVSCHRDHPDAGRVTSGNAESYLRDEAWFLPRLHACAVRAGVPAEAPEMRHLSRWAFMRARQLGALGEPELATQLLTLAITTAGTATAQMRLIRTMAAMAGWRMTGTACQLVERVRNSRKRRLQSRPEGNP